MSFSLKDLICGKLKGKVTNFESVNGDVVMPEGSYPCTVWLTEKTWTRSRFVKPNVIRDYSVYLSTPIPTPGIFLRNNTEYVHVMDCVDASSVQEALIEVAESIKETRINRSGQNWCPVEGFITTDVRFPTLTEDENYARMGALGVSTEHVQKYSDSIAKLKEYEKKI